MLAYVGTKEQFLDDAPDIQDKVKAAVEAKLGIKVPVGGAGVQQLAELTW